LLDMLAVRSRLTPDLIHEPLGQETSHKGTPALAVVAG
jgi:hypothetical protein